VARSCPSCYNALAPGEPSCTHCGARQKPACRACGSEQIQVSRRLTWAGRRAVLAGLVLLPLFGLGLALILLGVTLSQRDVRCFECLEDYGLDELA
jgi:hypothetical protein